MTTQPKRTVAFALCGSFCSFSAVLPQVRLLAARGGCPTHFKRQRCRAGHPLRHGRRPAADLVRSHRPQTADHLAGRRAAGPAEIGRRPRHCPGHRHNDGPAGGRDQFDPGHTGRQEPFARRAAHRHRTVHERWAFGQCSGAGPAFAAAALLFCALRPGRQLQKAVQLKERFYPSARHPGSRPARRADTTDAVVICGRAGGI